MSGKAWYDPLCRACDTDRRTPFLAARRLGLTTTLAAVLLVLACRSWSAVSGGEPPSPGNSPVAIAIHTADGRVHTGQLRSLNAERVTLAVDDAGATASLPLADVLHLEFSGDRHDFPENSPAIYLANGDCLFGQPLRLDAEHLTAGWTNYPDWPPLRIPLETVRGWMTAYPATRSERMQLFAAVLERRDRSDALLLRNGDEVAGELKSLEQSAYAFATAAGATNVPVSQVRAVTLNPELISLPDRRGPRVLAELKDGSQLTFAGPLELAEGNLRATAVWGPNLSIPIAVLATLRVLDGRAVYLSDLEPAEYRFTPYLSGEWPLRRDRALSGGPLVVAGRCHAKGLAMHSRSEVAYRLGGNFRQFRAAVGIDALARCGNAAVSVLIDDRRVFYRDSLTARDGSVEIRPIDLAGAQTLTLRVDFGPAADIDDHVDWLGAMLVR